MKRLLLPAMLALGCGDDGSTAQPSGTDATSSAATSSSGTDDAASSTESSTGSDSTSTSEGTTVSSTAPPITTTDSASSGGNVDDSDVIFVNFDGGPFTLGSDDASADRSAILMGDTTIAPYAGDRATVLNTIQADFAPFDVTVTDQRPATGSYAMVVITPTDVLNIAGVAGVGTLDCGDEVRQNVAFAFTDEFTDPVVIGSVASSRLGSTFGIENASDPGGLSSGQVPTPGDDPAWLDMCIGLEFAAECNQEHAVHCPDGQQNAFAELTELFGPA